VPTSDQITGLGSKTDRPHLNTRADLSRVQLTPTEGFILSRIDGRVSYDEICRMSSLGREETLAILRKLKQQKLILGPGEAQPKPEPKPEPKPAPKPEPEPKPAPAPRATHRAPRPDPAGRTPAPTVVTDEMLRKAQDNASGAADEKKEAVQSVLERLDDGSRVDAAALAEGHDLSNETKTRILRLHRRLRKLEPHVLLGVSPGADTATIKRAFAAASKELHPDRYFGKDLGGYRDKLAQIFARITEAVQALHKASKARR
jgi:DnaJ-domain-containing protein 1